MTHAIRPIPDIEYKLALLQYIHSRGDVRSFLKASGNDIARLCTTVDLLVAGGYVVKEGKQLLLSDKGRVYLDDLNKQLQRKGLYASLLPDYSVRREKLKITDTYIPQYMYKRGGGHFSNSYVLGRSGDSQGDKESAFKHNE